MAEFVSPAERAFLDAMSASLAEINRLYEELAAEAEQHRVRVVEWLDDERWLEPAPPALTK